jgi:hypothetical protein
VHQVERRDARLAERSSHFGQAAAEFFTAGAWE